LAIATVLVIVAAGITAWFLTDRLVSETNEVSSSTGEVLIATQQVRASFAEADTASVSVHLAGADGNREQRRLYEQAMDRATSSLERVARLVGDDEISHDALQDIAGNATDYAGLIDAARLASIQELATADDMLGEATTVNRDAISPQVQTIADRARVRFDSQTQTPWYLIAIIALVVALVVLVLVQVRLNRQFRRVINVPLALATVALIVLIGMAGQGFGAQQSAFDNAEEEAFDAIQVSEQIQQLAYRHRALGTSSVLGGADVTDELAPLEGLLVGDKGLFAQARQESSSDRERAAATEISDRWDAYVFESSQAQVALVAGDTERAEQIAQGAANSSFNGFNASVEAALLDNREQFLNQLQTASDSLRWLRAVILIGSLLAAMLTWWGFGQRIGEYR